MSGSAMPSEHPVSAVPGRPGAPARQTRRRWLQSAAAVAGGAVLGGWRTPAHADSLAVGQPAPPLVLHSLDGRAIDTRDLRGQVVVLTFWATWCGPCHAELPLLSAYAKAHAGDGLAVLGFSLDGPDSLAEVRKMAAALSFPVGLLGSAYAGGYGRIWRIPVNFTIDRGGLLAANGWDDDSPAWTAERLERVVTPLLRR